MKKTNFIVVTVEEESKYYSYCVKADSSKNLLSVLNIKNIITANICDTFKQAREFVTVLNDTYKRNGTYMFADCPMF